MSLLHRLCNKRVLVSLLLLNLLSILLLLLNFDVFRKDNQRDLYRSAFERWKHMRDTWRVTADNDEIVIGYGYSGELKKLQNGLTENGADDIRGRSLRVDTPLDFIPRVPNYSLSDIVAYLLPNITQRFLRLPKGRVYNHTVVILTPVCDVAGHLPKYGKLLRKLTYPRKLMSVYFGEDSSSDDTLKTARIVAEELKNDGFRDAGVFHFNLSGGVHGTWGDIHDEDGQHERRSHLAKARNKLWQRALKDEDYVMWIDSDVSDLPPDLLQQLMFARKHVTVASCLFHSGPYKRNYDKNTWRETEMSIKHQERLPEDYLIVEGYSDSKRIFLPDLRAEGRIVPVDGVGGCSLLVNATCHRKGLEFPERIYKNHIETEGLAKMAKDMGYSVYGMPFVEVFH